MSLRIFGYVTLTIVCLAIGSGALTLCFWILDREVPVEVQRSELLTPEVEPGGKLVIRQQIDYIRNCSAHVDRAVYDAHTRREFLPDIDYERPPLGLGVKTVTFEIDVPASFEPGAAEYRALPVYVCNALQRIYWPIIRPETIIPFTVVSVAKVP